MARAETPADSGRTLEPGALYIVSTPIGNLGDCSPRAKAVLQQADAVACEDTRVTGRLLRHLGIVPAPPLLSYRDENEAALAPGLVERLRQGETLALVADAGTPTLSDPGFRLVRACRKARLPVLPVPGPAAAIAALSASGLPTDQFLFAGFLPPKKAARRRFLEANRDQPYTLVLYESTHRMEKFLEDIEQTLGPERVIAIAREMTKLHETYLTGPVRAVREQYQARSRKGEFVVCIARQGFAL